MTVVASIPDRFLQQVRQQGLDDLGQPVKSVIARAGAPTDYLREQFVIRAYSEEEEIADAAMVQARDFSTMVERFFESPETAFLHVRFPAYGCFALRIDRA